MSTLESDSKLLRAFIGERSEAAFGALVSRHLTAVYSVALRRVGGDAHLAEDVVQTVFATLARKAAQLVDRTSLGGWLHRTTNFVACDAARVEARRRRRDREAIVIEERSPGVTAQVDWEQLRVVLDELMQELDESDRDAIWLRFYQGHSFAAVAAVFDLKENTVRMRIDRALDRLRAALGKRGVTSTIAALETALASQAALPPETLSAAAIQAGLVAGSPGAGVGAISLLIMSKTQFGVLAAVIVGLLTVGLIQMNENIGLRRRVAALSSERKEVAQLRSENSQITAAIAKVQGNQKAEELARLRQRASTLAARPPWVDEIQPLEVAEMKDVGWDSVDAALQTFIWARASGNAKVLADQFAWVGSARGPADAAFAALSESVRAKWGTPDRLAGAVVFAGQPGLSGYETVLDPRNGLETVRGAPLQLKPADPADPVVRVWAGIDPDVRIAPAGIQFQIIAWVQTASGTERREFYYFTNAAAGNGRWTTGLSKFNEADWSRITAAIDPNSGEVVSQRGGTQ